MHMRCCMHDAMQLTKVMVHGVCALVCHVIMHAEVQTIGSII